MTHLVHINPLLFEPGDRLSLAEFLERWEQMPGLQFAELIDGVVHVPSPVSYSHSSVHSNVQGFLWAYAARTGVCDCLTTATWLMMENAPQPDVAVILLPKYGGRTRIRDKFASGAPELVVEVSGSSRSFDLGPKLALYQRAGVQEYLALLLEEKRAEWRYLQDGSYRLLAVDSEGTLKSAVFPGLWLDERALWTNDRAALLDTLQRGLESEECNAFLARLNASGT